MICALTLNIVTNSPNTVDATKLFTCRRATAIISQTLEALPVLSISLPIGFGLASKPDLVQNAMTSSPFGSVPLLVANLIDGSLWF